MSLARSRTSPKQHCRNIQCVAAERELRHTLNRLQGRSPRHQRVVRQGSMFETTPKVALSSKDPQAVLREHALNTLPATQGSTLRQIRSSPPRINRASKRWITKEECSRRHRRWAGRQKILQRRAASARNQVITLRELVIVHFFGR